MIFERIFWEEIMKIDERDRDKVRKSLEHELGREVSDEEVASSYMRINMYLQSLDLDSSYYSKQMSGYEILTSWFRN